MSQYVWGLLSPPLSIFPYEWLRPCKVKLSSAWSILVPRALLFCAWRRERRALGNPGMDPALISFPLEQWKCFWLDNLLRAKNMTIQEAVGAKKKELQRDYCAAKQFTKRQPWATPLKKLSNTNVNICRCCNFSLSNIYDRMHLYGKTAEKENLVEKLEEIGGIEVPTTVLITDLCSTCNLNTEGLPALAKANYK